MLGRDLKASESEARVETMSLERSKQQGQQAGRSLKVLKSFVLSALVVVTLYAMLDWDLFNFEQWLPVAATLLGALFAVRFSGVGYFADLMHPVWVLIGLLTVLVTVKGLSLIWSVGLSETVEEFMRSSMYLAVFILTAASLSSRKLVGPLVDGMALVVGAVAGYGVLQKTSPVGFPPKSIDGVRVDSTLGYSNTVAVVLGMGIALGLSRMAALRNPLARGLYAALILVFGAVLYFTFSRGGMLSLGVGLAALFVVSERQLQMLANLLLVCVPLAWLIERARDLKTLSSYTSDEALRAAEGAAFGTDLLVAVLAAFVLQAGFAALIRRYRITPGARRVLGAAAVVALLAGVSLAGYSVVDRQMESGSFFGQSTEKIKKTEDLSGRLASFGLNDDRRIEYWKVAWKEWKEHPLTGTGAGTFEYTWIENRPDPSSFVKQVHNVYLEQGTETGAFAFLALSGFAVFLVFYTARRAWRASGERRVLLSGLLAAVVVYLVSSGLEWHWYIPASTIFFFLLAGAAAKFASKPEWEIPEEANARQRVQRSGKNPLEDNPESSPAPFSEYAAGKTRTNSSPKDDDRAVNPGQNPQEDEGTQGRRIHG